MKKSLYLFSALILCIGKITASTPVYYPSFSVSASATVNATAIFKDTLIMAGDFTNPGSRIVQWNGAVTSVPAGATFNASIRSMLVYNNELYVGGNFTSPANRIVKWDGTTWTPFGAGANNEVRCMTQYNGELYMGGNFTSVNGISASNLAKFNGTNWNAIPNAPNGEINAMAVYKGELYVSGIFTLAGAVSVTNIAKFNGTVWTALQTGISTTALCMQVYNDTLYVGGDFTTANGTTVNRIAKWDGAAWFSTGAGANATVSSMIVYNNELYIGGNFTTFNGLTVSRLVYTDNKIWKGVVNAANAVINTMNVYKKDLYLGGTFTSAFSNTVSGVARTRMIADEPTTLSSAAQKINITPNQATVAWTKGNGSKRLVCLKKDSTLTNILASSTPVDTFSYQSNSIFGSGYELGYKNYVVGNSPDTFVNIAGLLPESKYYTNIWEYGDNGQVGFENYAPVRFDAGFFYTHSKQPDTATSNIVFSQVNLNSMRVTFNKGSGKYTLVVARKGAAVNALPVDGKGYVASTNFGVGDTITTGQFVVFQRMGATDTSFILSGLDIGTTYHFAAYEFNASLAGLPETNNYLEAGATQGSQSSRLAEPTVSSHHLTFKNRTATSVRAIVYKGNGAKRMFVCREDGVAFGLVPIDGVKYTFNTDFGMAPEITNGSGDKIVYMGTDSVVTITNLKPDVFYNVDVYEYNGDDLSANYTNFGADSWAVTLGADPLIPVDSIVFSGIEINNMSLEFNSGDGTNRIVIAKAKSPVNFVPLDTVEYSANSFFGAGTELGSGNFVVYNGSGNSVLLQNLNIETKYYFAVYEYTGSTVLAYNYAATPKISSHFTLNNEPDINVSRLEVINTTTTSMTLTWTRGNGTNRIVIGRKAGVVYGPTDGVSYNAVDSFGKGTNLGLDQFIVYKGTTSSVKVLGLEPNTTYYFAMYEFNGANGSENYNMINPPGLFQTTLVPEPTTAASNLTMTPITGGISRISWTNGNGENRVVVVRENADLSENTDDGNSYTPNETFGAGEDIGGGNFICYLGQDNGFTLQGLDAKKAYYVAVIEFNGLGMGSNYLTSGFPVINNLPPTPLMKASNMSFITYDTADRIKVTWENGDGAFRILVARKDNAVNSKLTDGETYEPDDIFGNGTNLGADNFVVYSGTGNATYVRGLDLKKEYYFALYEYNQNTEGPINYANMALVGKFSKWSVGTNELSAKDGIKFYPTLVTDVLYITETTNITITNALGLQLYNGKTQQVDFSAWPSGVYFVQSEAGICKVIKQ
jgi:hypothetical protein